MTKNLFNLILKILGVAIGVEIIIGVIAWWLSHDPNVNILTAIYTMHAAVLGLIGIGIGIMVIALIVNEDFRADMIYNVKRLFNIDQQD